MELFTINRYTGEDKDPKCVEKNENKLLEKLIEKAKSRKRKYEENVSKNISTVNETEQTIVAETDIDCSIENESNIRDELKIEEPSKNTESIEGKENEIAAENFQVLGDDVFKKKAKVETVLPSWLAYPTIIVNKISNNSESVIHSVENLTYLSTQLLENLKKMEIKMLFPVQYNVIPWIINAHSKPAPFRPRDICVSAPTGSGKTLAFAIPIVHLLTGQVQRKIRALVVLPVNELAQQVYAVFKQLTHKTNVSVCLLSKAFQLNTEQQHLIETFQGKCYSKVDIVVTTPGRLVEHLHATKGFCLKSLKLLIIDEADKIMEQIQHNWLYHLDENVKKASEMIFSGRSVPLSLNELENSSKKQPHKLLFSATLSQDPEKLQNLKLFQPKLFTSVMSPKDRLPQLKDSEPKENDIVESEIRGAFVGKYTTPLELSEKYCLTENRLKPLTLYALIYENNWNKFLCFTNTTDSTRRLSCVLQFMFGNSKVIDTLSSSLTQKKRTKALDQFSRGKINGLICSDALARGVDIPQVDVVISYDVPRHVKTYIHRIGRTARAGRNGTAITILASNELDKFQETIAEGGKEVKEEIHISLDAEEKFAGLYSSALKNLQSSVLQERKLKILKKNITKAKVTTPSEKQVERTFMNSLQEQIEEKLINKITNEDANQDDKIPKKFRKNVKKHLRK